MEDESGVSLIHDYTEAIKPQQREILPISKKGKQSKEWKSKKIQKLEDIKKKEKSNQKS